MTDKQILFSAPMVRALLEDRKTQTRRVVKPPPMMRKGVTMVTDMRPGFIDAQGVAFRPRYAVGDRLWVRETWATERQYDGVKPRDLPRHARIWYLADGVKPEWCGKTRPGIFLPRWASRLTLEVTEVRCQRLKQITPYDALCEGVDLPIPRNCEAHIPDDWPKWPKDKQEEYVKGAARTLYFARCADADNYVKAYAELWDSINGKAHPWAENPWVWAYSFRRLS